MWLVWVQQYFFSGCFSEKKGLWFLYIILLFVFDPVRYDNIFCCGLFLENVFSMLIQILVLYAFPLNISYLTYILLDCFIYRLNVWMKTVFKFEKEAYRQTDLLVLQISYKNMSSFNFCDSVSEKEVPGKIQQVLICSWYLCFMIPICFICFRGFIVWA